MSTVTPVDALPDQRLHPWSWLFVLLMQLRQFLLPLVALLVFGGRGDRDEMWTYLTALIVIAVLVGVSILQYLSFRYHVGRDAISVRSGIVSRNRREIPFARIHNVVVHQNPLHRLFGVAELRLESAGGHRPEAEMRVLKLSQALALEQLVRQRGQAVPPPVPAPGETPAGEPAPAAAPAEAVLLQLRMAEVLRIGLLSNRGWVAVLAAWGASYQFFPRGYVSDAVEHHGRQAFGYASHLHPATWVWVAAAVFMIGGFWTLLRLLSVALALLRYHGFRLTEHERRLTVSSGLFTRMRTSVARRRIQAWTLRETALQRWFGRRQLRIDIAAGGANEDGRDLRELAPLATPAACDALLQHLLPQVQWPPAQWQPVPQHGWWRLCLPALVIVPLLAAGAVYEAGPWGALLLAWLPWSAFRAHREMARMGYHVDARYIAVRGGWWTRWWRLAELDKLQSLRLARSPLDRLLGTASLWLDTAGASGSLALRLRFLPEADARALLDRLNEALARRRLR